MAVREFVRHKTEDKDLEKVQDNIRDFTEAVSSNVRDSSILNDVALDVVAAEVPHKLGRQPSGWSVLDIDAAATVHRTDWDENFIYLIASAPVTVALEVF